MTIPVVPKERGNGLGRASPEIWEGRVESAARLFSSPVTSVPEISPARDIGTSSRTVKRIG
jgi:hypothetical protein